MDPSAEKPEEIELELPALDGEEEPLDPELAGFALDVTEEGHDPFDDSTGESAPYDDLSVEGNEGGWLVDADSAHTLDLGGFDVVVRPEDSDDAKLLEDGEAAGVATADDLIGDDERAIADGGEEGPLDGDEELREEDLPALDADEDGDVADDELFDRALLAVDEELRWDDRAWSRVTDLEATIGMSTPELLDDSGVLAAPGEDPMHATRDATWKRLEETSRPMAAAVLPGGSVVLALESPDHARVLLVRVQSNGEARIIAEVEPRPSRVADEGEGCSVTFLRWDTTRGCLFVGGSFGVEAYRPSA